MKKKWYVLRTRASKEFRVEETIMKSIENTPYKELIEEIRIPTKKTYQIREGKKIEKKQKLFSSYVLIKVALTTEVKDFLLNTTNVSSFLGHGKKPLPLTKKEVEELNGMTDDNTVETLNQKFIAGDIVEVKSGPFEGFEGVVKEYVSERSLIKINVTVFGKVTVVEVSSDQVEKKA